MAGPVRNPTPSIMPAAERRRASHSIRLALEVAHQAVQDAGVDPALMASVFTSCDGDGDTIHAVCDAITQSAYPVSPTKFTNSVHNAAAGYWGIAVAAREPSTSLCAWENSAFAGLAEAGLQIATEQRSVLLVTTDVPMPEPLYRLHATGLAFGCAMVLVPAAVVVSPVHAWLELSPRSAAGAIGEMGDAFDSMPTPWPATLPADLAVNPAAALLPLLAAIATISPGDTRSLRCGDLNVRVML